MLFFVEADVIRTSAAAGPVGNDDVGQAVTIYIYGTGVSYWLLRTTVQIAVREKDADATPQVSRQVVGNTEEVAPGYGLGFPDAKALGERRITWFAGGFT